MPVAGAVMGAVPTMSSLPVIASAAEVISVPPVFLLIFAVVILFVVFYFALRGVIRRHMNSTYEVTEK
jgi:hypothetical protein